MKINVYDLNGNPIEKIDLPKVFSVPIRVDLIWRDVLSTLSKKRQPYGTNIYAGKRTAAHYHGRRRTRYSMMNIGLARMPRLHGHTVPWLYLEARFVPQARKGRRAHPPKVEKNWEEKINKKERKRAVMSAIAATAKKEIVKERGHKVDKVKELPLVVCDEIEKVSKTKQLVEIMKNLGLEDELKRVKKKKIRAGKGKIRGRRYKKKIGPLIVVSKDEGIGKAARNIPGVDVCRVENLGTYILAPGAMPGRLTIWSKGAILKLDKLFAKWF